jgi:hypothetical protein
MQAFDLQIRVHGWTLVQVAGEYESWCYTIGLVEHYHHPELVLIDVRSDVQHSVIKPLVELIVQHGELPPEPLAAEGLSCAPVHDDHLAGGLFAVWVEHYRRFPRAGDFIQVCLPADAYCECHAPSVRRLDVPGPLPAAPGLPNRAARRRRT